jgi:hypothetical protein
LGEFSFFTLSLGFVLTKKPCDPANTTAGGMTCYGGYGGDFRNGTTNGLDGADLLCTEAAQRANHGDKHLWRAFLSVANYKGSIVNAIDRIGSGPWYSAPAKTLSSGSYETGGLLVASTPDDLIRNVSLHGLRPNGATTVIYTDSGGGMWPFNQCLLDENGVCPLAYVSLLFPKITDFPEADDHDVLTGSDTDGKLMVGGGANCDDWTNSNKAYGAPVIGHSWPRSILTADNTGSVEESHWCSTTGHVASGCGAIINITDTNYGSAIIRYGGGVGSEGGYGAIYCFAYSDDKP